MFVIMHKPVNLIPLTQKMWGMQFTLKSLEPLL